jgi:hypothetical protein
MMVLCILQAPAFDAAWVAKTMHVMVSAALELLSLQAQLAHMQVGRPVVFSPLAQVDALCMQRHMPASTLVCILWVDDTVMCMLQPALSC